MPHTTPTTPPEEEAAARHQEDPAGPGPAAIPHARYPGQAVPGIDALWQHTLGHPDVIIGVVDGPPDLTHPCLDTAHVQTRDPWWLPPTPADDQAAQHGTFTASVLTGRHGSVLPGLAPHCRAVFVTDPADEDNPPDPLSAAHAIEELVEAGAAVIQYTPAHHTASDDAHPLLKRAITHALQAGVLITAPAGNDYGACAIAPALLPGVLAVGAHRADGAMFYFSNHGPAYTGHGLVTLGEAVLGATPGDGGIKPRKGTCTAVALTTGIAALLISLQHHFGQHPDPLAIGDALLATARPCTRDQAHGRPERCLNGYLDLPAATAHLFHALAPLQPAPGPAAQP
ncbi:S8 family serine peptidase [Actinomadura fulvescens]|uniref:Peptidase S8/S53 domain-containing protein n=1 Tax=Actinomadura fulvescens TaxID=46160 RepID=A0ABN3QXW9_9ACTN